MTMWKRIDEHRKGEMMITNKAVTRGTVMDLSDDLHLMEAVAHERDRDAFAELYRRHKLAAYNLARYLLRNGDNAEDALQDAFAAVWASAASFRPGNARAWILRIVARKCFLKIKKAQKYDALKEKKERAEPAPLNESLAEKAEGSELTFMLNCSLERLPTQERKIVALYYGVGMSQDDVARALDIPQRTISFRIKGILSRLRVELAKSGVAFTVTQVSAEAIRKNVCSHYAVPPTLDTSILKTSLEPLMPEKAISAPMPRYRYTHFLAWSASAGILLTLSALAWWPEQPNAPKKSETMFAGREDESSKTKNQSLETHLPINWSFESEAPSNLAPTWGTWKWRKGENGKNPAMQILDEVWVRLPSGIRRQPLAIFLRCRNRKKGSNRLIMLGSCWMQSDGTLPRLVYTPLKTPHISERQFLLYFYIWGRRHATVLNGNLVQVSEYDHAYPMDNLFWGLSEIEVESIELRAATLEEIPPNARAPDLKRTGLFKEPKRMTGFD